MLLVTFIGFLTLTRLDVYTRANYGYNNKITTIDKSVALNKRLQNDVPINVRIAKNK